MNIKKLTYRNILKVVLLILTFSACTGNKVPVPEKEDMRICWNVIPEEMAEGRALIDDDEALQQACTPSIGGKEIGIWSAYELEGQVKKNVLGEEGDVSLIYLVDTEDDNYEWWTYGEKAAEWVSDATYYFNAYFPKDAIQIIPSSDVTTFVARYNTATTQEDLMLAYTEVSTPVYPVPLQLHHALAALKFRFRFDDKFTGMNDRLTACWLENTAEQGLCMQGLLEFGTGGAGEALSWELENSAYVASGIPFYEWKNSKGLPFTTSATDMATAYSSGDWNNDGWLLIVPQESDGTVNICFQTQNAGDVVHRVRLPLHTGTNQIGMQYANGTWFAPARRYTYNLVITPTTVNVTLGIANWNELESSYDITF